MTAPRLILARHGQTDANVRRALDSRPPGPPLTDQGRRQALELAESLAREPVVGVYASTAVRAQETAEPIAAAHDLRVEVVEGAQEIDMGDLEGRTDREAMRVFVDVFGKWSAGTLDVGMPGGESGRDVVDRYGAVVESLRRRHPDGTAVLVSHGGVIRLVAPLLAANVDIGAMEPALIPNVGRVVLEPDGAAGWRVTEWTGIQLPG